MPSISGRLIFDVNRTATPDPSYPGIASVSIVLQNTSTNRRLIVLTDSNGNFQFDNVDNGTYRLIESYGLSGGVATPGDFSNSTVGSTPTGQDPPISFAPTAPSQATNLDSLSPNYLSLTVSGVDITNLSFIDGPVKYSPISNLLDPCATVTGTNILTAAFNGTFGFFSPPKAVNLTPASNPYPGVTANLTYVANTDITVAGRFTSTNIVTNLNSSFWKFSNRTSGDESKAMIISHPSSGEATLFQQIVTVTPSTNYLFAAWVMNILKDATAPNPQIYVRVLDQTGAVLYEQMLTEEVQANLVVPEWKQIGTSIYTGSNSQITVKFMSNTASTNGNYIALDDLTLQQITVPTFVPAISCNKLYVYPGETLSFTTNIENTCQLPLTNVHFQDSIPTNTTFVSGSVVINGVDQPTLNPEAGFDISNVNSGDSANITYSILASNSLATSISNSSSMQYQYTPIQGGIPTSYSYNTNTVVAERLPLISGRLIFDVNRTAISDPTYPGIANVSIVLQNTTTNQRLVVMTDSNGNFEFVNVPNGNYILVESFGVSGGVSTPGDFSTAVVGSTPTGQDPPVSYAPTAPSDATNLDSLSPNCLSLTVSGADITNLSFIDGPVKYSPISNLLDSCTTITGSNILLAAVDGTFGSFPIPSSVNTTPATDPFTGLTTNLTYIANTDITVAGRFTNTNIVTNLDSSFWKFANKTSGDESKAMFISHPSSGEATLFQQAVTVTPGTNYLFSAWVMNILKDITAPTPQMYVRILDQNGSVLYEQMLTEEVQANLVVPEWKQIGTCIYTGTNVLLTIKFMSNAATTNGNYFALDDLTLQQITVPTFEPILQANKSSIFPGETFSFTTTIENTCQSPLTDVYFQNSIPIDTTFIAGSVTENSVSEPTFDPEAGFYVNNISGGSSTNITYSVQAANSLPDDITNIASLQYKYTPVQGGIPTLYSYNTNEVVVNRPPLISGRLIFDVNRTAISDTSYPGIANVSIILQNTTTNERLVVMTDSDGNFEFINVPNGDYILVESFGVSGGVSTPGDFSNAIVGSAPTGQDPPVSYAPTAPTEATNLDSLSPNIISLTVLDSDITDVYFLDGPVKYTSIDTLLDSCVTITGSNILTAAFNGTFGIFTTPTSVNTTPATNPFPGLTTNLTYVANTDITVAGRFTNTNIVTNLNSNFWKFANKTSGDESKSMLISHPSSGEATLFHEVVTVSPSSNYLFTAWVMNIIKDTTVPNPQMYVRVLDQTGSVLYEQMLTEQVQANLVVPEWKQIGTSIYTGTNTQITVKFMSKSASTSGNYFAIDDLTLQQIEFPVFEPTLSCNKLYVSPGETLSFTTFIEDTCQNDLTNVYFQNNMPFDTTFIVGSVVVNSISNPALNPEDGFYVSNVSGGSSTSITYSVQAANPLSGSIVNIASLQYKYTPVIGGIPTSYSYSTNDIIITNLPLISGRLIFDVNRTAIADPSYPGIANVSIILQNTATNERLAVLTDSDGNFTFFNVPNGNYILVESFGVSGGVPTPGDFSTAIVGSVPTGQDPPVSYALTAPIQATNLDSLSPNIISLTVLDSDITDVYFLDGPVKYTPINTLLDSCVTIIGSNILTAAVNGTLGSFTTPISVNTTPATNPFPGLTSNLTYVADTDITIAGRFTNTNIVTNLSSNFWKFTNKTSGDESKAMIISHPLAGEATLFQQVVTVSPSSNYLFAAWVMNIIKNTTVPNPQIYVRVLDQTGSVLYEQMLTEQVQANLVVPEWKQIGTSIYTGNNTQITVKFMSNATSTNGNYFAIDDLTLQKITVPTFEPTLASNKSYVILGETLSFTTVIEDTCQSALTNLYFQDNIPIGTTFIAGSVTINNVSEPTFNPETGFYVNNVSGGTSTSITYSVLANSSTSIDITNVASLQYEYTPVRGGIRTSYYYNTNEVIVNLSTSSDLNYAIQRLIDFINNVLLDIDCADINPSVESMLTEFKFIIELLKNIILSELVSNNELPIAFKAQLQRYADSLVILINIINAVPITNTCILESASFILNLVLSTTLLLLNISEILLGLLTYTSKCDCLGASVFNMFAGNFVNRVTCLYISLDEWRQLISILYQANMIKEPSYVASYVPKQSMKPQAQQPMKFACTPCQNYRCNSTKQF